MAPDVERKLAAILSADVVGYSRLMAEDEAATIRTLTDYREEIAMHVRQHRGRVVDTPGDNLLAEFPTALDAVRSAVEIQGVLRALNASLPNERRMDFRIGVHMGDVSVEGEKIYGDGVNIAARLEALAEAGGVCISATVHEQVRNKLDVGFTDLGDQTIKNIPDQIRVYRVQPRSQPEALAPASASPGQRPRHLRTALVATAAVLLLLALGLWASWPRPLGLLLDRAGLDPSLVNPPLPDKPSVVVLPFLNLSDEPEQEYLADGLTEELTSDLASNPWVFVISRSSAFTYKGATVNVAEVSRELGVRYVVEGSVRKAGERVRITSQLIDASQDVHVWSQRYDRELEDILVLQSEISEKILAALEVEIRKAEVVRAQRKPTESLSAWEAFVRGVAHFRRYTKRDFAEARRLLERAIEVDPEYADAHATMASSYLVESTLRCSLEPERLARAKQMAERALSINPYAPVTQVALANVALAERRWDQAIAPAERAVELAPSFDAAHAVLGLARLANGEPLAGLDSLGRAFRLNPRAPAPWWGILGLANWRVGRTDRAMELWERANAANPEVVLSRAWLAAAHEGRGEHEEAGLLTREILRLDPDCSAQALAAQVADPKRAAWLRDNLRKAGLP
jgi:adenylate cyclase